ncbi:MAG: formylglycine-generating enzyme family protein [Candidatus Electrothrix gigas]
MTTRISSRMPYRNHLSPPQFPAPWAVDWGEDRYGLWMSFAVNQVRQTFRWMRPGTFLMGATGKKKKQRAWLGQETLHKVTLTQGFWLADTTVTQKMWHTVMLTSPSGFQGDLHPVTRISWQDAQTFLSRLNRCLAGLHARLPTEAEWEYACRAGSTTPFSTGAEISPNLANYNENNNDQSYRKRTTTVKRFPCNAWGLFDMHGNVWEWCQDYWQPDVTAQDAVDPQGPNQGNFRVARGGSWANDAYLVRSACRVHYPPNYCFGSVGIRLAV